MMPFERMLAIGARSLARQLIMSPADVLAGDGPQPLSEWRLRPALALVRGEGAEARLGELLLAELEARELAPMVAIAADMQASRFVEATAAFYWATALGGDRAADRDVQHALVADDGDVIETAVSGTARRMEAAYLLVMNNCAARREQPDWEGDDDDAVAILDRLASFAGDRAAGLRPVSQGNYGDSIFGRLGAPFWLWSLTPEDL